MARQNDNRKGWRSRYWMMAALALPTVVMGQAPLPNREQARVAIREIASPRRFTRTFPAGSPFAAEAEAIDQACGVIASCKQSYSKVTDYSCTFFKKERIDGKLLDQNVMLLKARTQPASFYLKFLQPDAGREAIYVTGRHSNKAFVHDVGLGKLLAGTLKLEPTSSMAMVNCRHPISEAGIGHMIDVIDTAWSKELNPEESKIIFHQGATVGDRSCTMIESIHPEKKPNFMFHKVKVYIDVEHNLPIRFEAYDWPKLGKAPELIEEYIYAKLVLNVGLEDRDFDPSNAKYSFGHF